VDVIEIVWKLKAIIRTHAEKQEIAFFFVNDLTGHRFRQFFDITMGGEGIVLN
jgi:hypothetical protein